MIETFLFEKIKMVLLASLSQKMTQVFFGEAVQFFRWLYKSPNKSNKRYASNSRGKFVFRIFKIRKSFGLSTLWYYSLVLLITIMIGYRKVVSYKKTIKDFHSKPYNMKITNLYIRQYFELEVPLQIDFDCVIWIHSLIYLTSLKLWNPSV